MKHILVAVLFLSHYLYSDIRSKSGQINFDINNDQNIEMSLNQTGLGINTTPSANLEVQGNAIISTQFYIGSSTGSSNTNLNGSLGFGVQTVTSDLSLGHQAIVLADARSDNILLTLPTANSSNGRVYEIKRITDNSNYVHVIASDNIDDQNNYYDLEAFESIKLVSNGSQWFKLSSDSAADSVVASDNLMAWYKFNHSASLALDSSRNERHGSFVDDASVVEDYLDLDGTNDEVQVNSYQGETGTNPRTISLWMKKNGTPADDALVSWGENNSGEKYTFRTQDDNGSANTLRIEVNGGYYVGSTDVLDNVWHHVAVTWENDGSPNVNDHILYLDGEVEPSSTSASETMNTASTRDVYIGNDHSNRRWDGQLDDVRIYNKALSAEEIQLIYSKGR